MEIEVSNGIRIRGVTAIARRLRVSHSHLTRVLRGERAASPRFAARLRRLGITETINGTPLAITKR